MSLHSLKSKRAARIRKRKHHYTAFERFKKQRKRLKAKWHLLRFRWQKRAIRKLDRLIHKAELARKQRYLTGPYAGCEAVLKFEVEPCVANNRGTGLVTSGKRWETYGNPGSDHYAGNKTASARDFALNNDQSMARLLYAALTGNKPASWPGDYADFYISRHGATFRIQIIAATHGTGPHLHVGVKRA